MTSVGGVIAQLREVLARLASAGEQFARIDDLLSAASDSWALATDGSTEAKSAEVTEAWSNARDAVRRVAECLRTAGCALEDYLGVLGGKPNTGTASADSDAGSVASSSASTATDLQVAIRRAREHLGRGTAGSAARGMWIREDGTTEDLRSGRETAWFAVAERELRRIGGTSGRALARLATHIEVQFLFRMRSEGVAKATLVLDREPCGAPPVRPQPFTCDAQLDNLISSLLPVGSTVSVVDPEGTVWTYPREARQ